MLLIVRLSLVNDWPKIFIPNWHYNWQFMSFCVQLIDSSDNLLSHSLLKVVITVELVFMKTENYVLLLIFMIDALLFCKH